MVDQGRDAALRGKAAAAGAATPSPWRRYAPLLLMGLAVAAFWGFGLNRYVSLAAIVDHRHDLAGVVDRNIALAALAFVGLYTLCVAISFPGASLLTIAAGFLFGTWLGGVLAVFAATLGAMIIFGVARTSFGEGLAARAGPFLTRFAAGFEKDAFLYLLSLRLAPIFPFWLVNLAPALVGVRMRDFFLSTALGIIPGTFAFAAIGAGLDGLVERQSASRKACEAAGGGDCGFALGPADLVTPQLAAGLLALAAIALVPVVVRAWRGKKA